MKKLLALLLISIAVLSNPIYAAEVSTKYKPIDVSNNTYYVIQSDGALIAWGDSFHGATTSDVDLPCPSTENTILNEAVFVTSNLNLGLAIDLNQTLWGWGWNWTGRLLGKESLNNSPIPLLDNVVAVSAGLHHCIALKNDGSVWGWGSNEYGQLGFKASSSTKPFPYEATLIMDNIRMIATDHMHASFALSNDGTVWAWGKQDGTDKSVWSTPRPIIQNATDIAWSGANGIGGILVLDDSNRLWHSSFSTIKQKYEPPLQILDDVITFSESCAVTQTQDLWLWKLEPTDNGHTIVPTHLFHAMKNVSYADSVNSYILSACADGTLWEIRYPAQSIASVAPTYNKINTDALSTQLSTPTPSATISSSLSPSYNTQPTLVRDSCFSGYFCTLSIGLALTFCMWKYRKTKYGINWDGFKCANE